MYAHRKALALLAFAFVAFFPFCLSLGGLITRLQADEVSLSLMGFVSVFFFFLLSLTGVVFAAVLRSSYWFFLVAALFPVLYGFLMFQAPLYFFLIFGAPLALVYLIIKRTIGNRVRIHFSTDVRRPITTAYLILFLFGSFAVAPVADDLIKAHSAKLVSALVPESIDFNGERIDLDYSMQDLIEEEIESNIALCQGNAECEERLRDEVAAELEEQLADNPLLGGVDARSDRPMTEELVNKMINGFDNSPFFVALERNGVPRFAVWAVIIFLIISPFTVLFSLASVLFMAVVFDLLKIFRVFRVEKQNVRQDIIC